LTFTRRAALEMTRRAQQILVASQGGRAAGGAEAPRVASGKHGPRRDSNASATISAQMLAVAMSKVR
jgi:hypothetical protein